MFWFLLAAIAFFLVAGMIGGGIGLAQSLWQSRGSAGKVTACVLVLAVIGFITWIIR